MAGAGPVTEKLPQIKVDELLCEAGRLIKWDDQDVSGAVYHLEVDPKGQVIYWRPEDFSKDTEVLELVHVRDVRTKQYARSPRPQDVRLRDALKAFCAFEQESNSIPERTITIVFGANFVDVFFVNFVASSISEAEEWTRALFSITNNLLEINASPLKCLERFYTRIYVMKNQEWEIPAKLLVKHFVSSKEDQKRAYDTLQSVGLASGKNDAIKAKDFTFDRFLEFYSRLVARHDLDAVFAELGAKKKPYLTNEQLVDFLNHRQRDPRLNEILYPYYNANRAQMIISTYETNTDFALKGYISINGLTRFLMSADSAVLMPEVLQIHQDMTFSLAHFFINSSHNTYLTGHQLTGKSSVEMYRQVLLAGCRCVELDCWDGRTEDQEPVITHGMTLCTEVLFKDVIEAIAESAFKTSDFPVILSFENHCSEKQQKKMASYCLQIFGEILLNKALDDFPLEPGKPLPGPAALKRKILIKNKKRAVVKSGSVSEVKSPTSPDSSIDASALSSSVASEYYDAKLDDIPEDAVIKDIIPKSEEEEEPEVEALQELSDLVNYFQPVHFRGFDMAEKVKRFYEMSSFSENAATSLLKEQPVEFVNYNKFQCSRIYPKGSRVSSDNYLPQMFWNAGCQLVALNYQTLDLPVMLNLGKFEINGRCGYLLKPEHMRRSDRTFDPFVESTVDGIIAGTVHVRVISGQCLSERRIGTYVEVEMYGLLADTVRRKYRTKVVTNNGLNPVYDEDVFKFKVILPSLAVLRFAVYEDNGKMIGHRVLPVVGLSPGFRHIKLRNESYQPLTLPTLFVDIVTKDYVPEGYADFADALANPMKYLSEKEKRSQQLERMMSEDDDAAENADVFSASGTADLMVPPLPSSLAAKRGSVVSLSGILNTPAPPPKGLSSKEMSNYVKSELKNATASRTLSLQPLSPELPPNNLTRSQSIPQDQMKEIRDGILELTAPNLDVLLGHKVYAKALQKHDTEMMSVLKRQATERAKINKDLEMDIKRLNCVIEKEKSNVQKKHAKLLKRSDKDHAYIENFNECTKEINDLNARHEYETELLMNNQKAKVKAQYVDFYLEQLNLARSHLEPRINELKKVIQLQEVMDKKKLEDRHVREMTMLKKDQDKFNRGELKDLSRKMKDKAELQKMKRLQNKKHIEQSVKERQKMKEFQDKEVDYLAKRYADLILEADQRLFLESKQLEEVYNKKCLELDTEDIRSIVPVLLPNRHMKDADGEDEGITFTAPSS